MYSQADREPQNNNIYKTKQSSYLQHGLVREHVPPYSMIPASVIRQVVYACLVTLREVALVYKVAPAVVGMVLATWAEPRASMGS